VGNDGAVLGEEESRMGIGTLESSDEETSDPATSVELQRQVESLVGPLSESRYRNDRRRFKRAIPGRRESDGLPTEGALPELIDPEGLPD